MTGKGIYVELSDCELLKDSFSMDLLAFCNLLCKHFMVIVYWTRLTRGDILK